ncbi:hypothetical protein [Anaerocolumna sp.]|uniref:hypothetical protein n=1 Tax=Anaerocolumna sp. TaxID=2041569 RepID=UPI0028AB766C|nr:hypothetical protein [Anaerocolumna sp.]
MSLTNKIKQNKVLLIIIPAVLIIAAILLILLLPNEKSYTFKTDETYFTVKFPSEWKVVEEPRQPGSSEFEPSPDEGIKLLLDGNEDNCISIYSQYGTITHPQINFDEEDFSTNKGIKGILYKDKECLGNWFLVLDQDITPNFYGAVVNFEDEELLNKNQKQIMNILKSIDIKKSQSK